MDKNKSTKEDWTISKWTIFSVTDCIFLLVSEIFTKFYRYYYVELWLYTCTFVAEFIARWPSLYYACNITFRLPLFIETTGKWLLDTLAYTVTTTYVQVKFNVVLTEALWTNTKHSGRFFFTWGKSSKNRLPDILEWDTKTHHDDHPRTFSEGTRN